LNEEQQDTNDGVDLAQLKAIGEKITAKAPNLACPFCTNTKWFVLRDKDKFPVVILDNLTNFATYTFACTNCGFVRQHVRSVVDGEVQGEVEYARSGS
jgi:hypothetical protein